jgi:uncharacterized protein (DUF302 family)
VRTDSRNGEEYAYTRRFEGRTVDQMAARTREALAVEGFGVLTEIDVQAILKKKLGVERRPYLILGACNPPLAHRALEAEPAIGVLLPCNVTVFEGVDGATYVQAIKPSAMFSVVANPAVKPVADEVAQRLERMLNAL